MKDETMLDGSRNGRRFALVSGVLALLSAWPAHGQAVSPGNVGVHILVSAPGPAARAQGGIAEVVRAIDDPATGSYWLLERDPDHPGGPGRLVMVSATTAEGAPAGGPKQTMVRSATGVAASMAAAPVIRAGDRLVVEENTAVVRARLEAVALGPAMRGGRFEVRLAIGGKAVRAVALGAGRAVFADQIGAQP